jgi:YD repeat-containing protein
VEFDPFGRVYREKRRTPSTVWAKRTTFFNAMGWKTDVSEWQQDGVAHTKFTKYLGYDVFGRPTTIRPPDGSTHDVTLSYAGVRSVNRTTNVATVAGGGETFDHHRDLRPARPSLSGQGTLRRGWRDRHHDLRLRRAGHLTSASTPSGYTQNRSFTFDSRGFLTSECHPEKGVSGNGCVTYSLYDARGQAGRKVDGSNDLRFFYDAAERLTQVNNNANGQPLKVLTWQRHGSDGPFSRQGENRSPLQHDRRSVQRHGADHRDLHLRRPPRPVSQRDTQNNFNGANFELFRQTFAWNDLGDISSQTYPDCAGYCTPSTPRPLSYGYTDGRVSSVSGFLSSITYNLSGLVNIVNHTNGTWDRWTADANFTGRPSSIEGFTNNWNPVPFGLWTTGTFQYDGAGNVKKMGNANFVYDGVSRLVSATVYPGPYNNGAARTQSYAYDAFGNMQSKTTNGVTTNLPTAGSSNHMTGSSYDGAGNQLSWNGATYEYDKLSMMTRMVSGSEDWRYIYTADDERFWSYRVGGGGSIWALRGLDGKVLRSYNAHVNWSNLTDYVYREGTLAAAVTNGVMSHLHPDHLGTPRVLTDEWGHVRSGRP